MNTAATVTTDPGALPGGASHLVPMQWKPNLAHLARPGGLGHGEGDQGKCDEAGYHGDPKTMWKLFAVTSIRTIASSGPMKAPTVSSDCLSPKHAPEFGRRKVSHQSRLLGLPDAFFRHGR